MSSRSQPSRSATDIAYRVTIRGVRDNDLKRDLEAVSDAIARIRRHPASERQLQRRLDGDEASFLRILNSYGFYQATVHTEVDWDRQPVRVRFIVSKGEPYRWRSIRLKAVGDAAADVLLPSARELGLVMGEVARADVVIRAEARLVAILQRQGYPMARIADRLVYLEHAAEALDLTLVGEPGPLATFGTLTLAGAPSVRESALRVKIPWREGDPYNADQVALARRRLMTSGLFASVRIAPEPEAIPKPALRMRVDLVERKPRTLALGAGYRSDQGARARIAWEHRNLSGAGERLHLAVAGSEIGYDGEARFVRSDFKRADQTLTVALQAAQEETDAFRSRYAGSVVELERPVGTGVTAGAGVGYRYVEVRENGGEPQTRFGLASIPMRLNWDRSDNWLDPRRGWRSSARVAPYADTLGSDLAFVKTAISYTHYLRLSRRPELDGAGRLSTGVLSGATREAVPADERFYAGGGGSVRGYAYQSAGDIVDGVPQGGISMLLVSAELRWRLTSRFGPVVFYDTGTASASSFPKTGELMQGAGGGLRYYTPVGPLRFDVAFPLDRRADIDKPYQFYISLGQAF